MGGEVVRTDCSEYVGRGECCNCVEERSCDLTRSVTNVYAFGVCGVFD